MFRAYVLIVRRAKLYYTVSGNITLKKKTSEWSKITKIIKIIKIQFYKYENYVLILMELYFNNFNYFSNFRPLPFFSVMIPETV